MGNIPTPNFKLTESHSWNLGQHDSRTLPAGSFVRPIETRYVPQHILDEWKWVDHKSEVFVYCRYGIVPVPKRILRKA